MRRPAALLAVLALAYAVAAQADVGSGRLRVTALALGVALIAASLAGDALERLRLPRLTGYLLLGVLCGPYVANIITRPMARELQVLDSLAVTLIAFVAGLEVNVARLRARFAAILAIGGTLLVAMYSGLFAVLWVLWPWLPIDPAAQGLVRLAQVAVLTTVVVSFSPAVTMAVIADSRARGAVSELSLALVILGEVVLLVAFTLVLQFLRQSLGHAGGEGAALAAVLSWELAGSIALGALIGSAFALYLQYLRLELTLVLLVLCVFIAQLTAALHVEPLLTALAAGFVVENIARPQGDALKHAVERGSAPVLVVFFAAAGASLQLDALAEVGLLALGLVLLRMALLRAGVAAASRLPVARTEPVHLAWMGLVSQAGVVLGLAVIIARQFPGWGLRLQTLVIAIVALNQFIGPAVFRLALARAGEVGAEDRIGSRQ